MAPDGPSGGGLRPRADVVQAACRARRGCRGRGLAPAWRPPPPRVRGEGVVGRCGAKILTRPGHFRGKFVVFSGNCGKHVP